MPSLGLKNDKYMFDNSQIDDSEEIIDTTQKSRTKSKKIFKSNYELLNLITKLKKAVEPNLSIYNNMNKS